MKLVSPSFSSGEAIPSRFTADGEDLSPVLRWSHVPEGTVEFALLCEDPHAPGPEPFVHWILYGIPPDVHELTEGLENGFLRGRNSFGTLGYRGPAPPRGKGAHRYRFELFALSIPLRLGEGAEREKLLRALRGRVLAKAEVVGTYERRSADLDHTRVRQAGGSLGVGGFSRKRN